MKGTTSGLFALRLTFYPSDAPAQWIKAFETRQGRGAISIFSHGFKPTSSRSTNSMKAEHFYNGRKRGTNPKVMFSEIWNF